MSVFTVGAMAQSGSAGQFWKLDDKSPNVAYILPPTLDKILSAPKFGVFVQSGAPMNASWVSIGDSDVGNKLGLKPTPKAFIWVWVPNNPKNIEEGGAAKMWECSKTHYSTIVTQVNEFSQDLQGLMIVLKKENNRWQLTANQPPKSRAVNPAVLGAAWETLVADGLDGSDESTFGKLVGVIQSPDLQKKFLIDRSQGKLPTWNDVLRAFNLPPEDDEDVESY